MSGEIYAIITTLCWSLGIFPFTAAAKRIGTASINQYRLLLAWVIISVILMLNNSIPFDQLFTNPNKYHYIFLGLSGIIGFTIGDFCSFTSFTLIGPKLGSLYTTFAPGAALIIGFLILGEKINFIGIAGIGITIAGVIWLTLSKKDKAAAGDAGFSRDKRGIILAIIGALCQGTGLALSKLGMDAYPEKLPTMHAVWIRLMFAFTAAFISSLFLKRLIENSKPIFKNQNNGIPFMILGTLLGPVCGVTCSLLAIQRMEVAVAQTIFALLPIFVLPVNLLIYKERITIQSVFACVTAIIGVLILIWRDKLV